MARLGKRIHQKLASQRRASLSMALMLLLVCTVLSSVVIAAATAAVGRQSQLQAADQSYYNVTSAASLFWDELSDPADAVSVEVVREFDVDASGMPVGVVRAEIDGQSVASVLPSSATYFQAATYDLVFGGGTPDQSIDWSKADPVPNELDFAKLNDDATCPRLTVSVGGANLAPVEVRVSAEEMGANDGIVTFGFIDAGESGYACSLQATVSADTPQPVVSGTHLTWTTTVRWQAIDVSTGGAS